MRPPGHGSAVRRRPAPERRILDLDVAEGGEPLASERGHARAGLDGGHRVPERGQRACRLTGTAAHLQHRRPPVHAGDGGQIREQLVRVGRPHAVVEPGLGRAWAADLVGGVVWIA
jgi:hypothetical protein